MDGRHSGSSATTLSEDFGTIREATDLDDAVATLEQLLKVPKQIAPEEFLREYSKEDFLLLLTYLTIFVNNARDWISKVRIGYDKTSNMLNEGFKPEWHHFFPKGKRVLKGAGVTDRRANAIANIVVLNEKTDRIISSNAPEVYILAW